ncbi:Acetyl esterase/lipase [Planctomycetales bacterium 10988]|nr:Acetyl esterase/lipase [Planctomycetales bacterium 10988]
MFKRLLLLGLTMLLATSALDAQTQSDRPDFETRAKQFLKRFPQADLNQDGTLTLDEARKFNQQRRGEKPKPTKNTRSLRPTFPDFSYGDHERQCFDLWLVPDADEPTPLAIYIHGGGFKGGDKSKVSDAIVQQFLNEGIAFCSMNYRLSDSGPYPMMMHDAARGLQTIRAHAGEWKINPEKVACFGGSAGAGITLWLAFHDDLADPDSEDPIARQSTRIIAAGTSGGQSTYDWRTYKKWFGVENLQQHPALGPFYLVETEEDLKSERVIKLMEDASPINHLTKDDQIPVYMYYGGLNKPVDETSSPGVWVHHVLLGLKLQEAMEKLGLTCIVRGRDVIPEHDPYGSVQNFLIAKLKE